MCSIVETGTTCFMYNGLQYQRCAFGEPPNDTEWCSSNAKSIYASNNGTIPANDFQKEKWHALVICLSCAVLFLIIIVLALCAKIYRKTCNVVIIRKRKENVKGSQSSPARSSLKRLSSVDVGDKILTKNGSPSSRRVSFHPSQENVSFHPGKDYEEEDDDGNSYIVSLTREISIASENEDVLLRKQMFRRQMTGDASLLNYTKSLNEQINILPYDTKYEIKREFFTEKEMIGSGNFGYVFLGEAKSLFYANSTTPVAIKTVNDPSDTDSVRSLLCEIKIMSQIELNLNLVNMVAVCTSQFVRTGEIWLLMEFCQLGDMKSYLIENRTNLLTSHNRKNSRGSWRQGGKMIEPVGSRILVQWAYDVAMGMKYLARKQIMHGDLAARNVMISAGEDGLLAKVGDFGLSKVFYDEISYKKEKRKYVPWKWMALEYLEDARFTITSDVWSYGVVLWEIFSLGKEPYPGKSYNEMLQSFRSGYRLPCPEEVKNIKAWSPLNIYNKITEQCFIGDPMNRSSFSNIVTLLENQLTEDEKIRYEMLKGRYLALRKMRRGSVANLIPKKTIMTQTSVDENETIIKQFMENSGEKEKNDGEETESNPEIRKNRPHYRRLTSVF